MIGSSSRHRYSTAQVDLADKWQKDSAVGTRTIWCEWKKVKKQQNSPWTKVILKRVNWIQVMMCDDVRSVLVELPTVGSTNEALAAESNISAEWKKKWEKCRSSSQLRSYCNLYYLHTSLFYLHSFLRVWLPVFSPVEIEFQLQQLTLTVQSSFRVFPFELLLLLFYSTSTPQTHLSNLSNSPKNLSPSRRGAEEVDPNLSCQPKQQFVNLSIKAGFQHRTVSIEFVNLFICSKDHNEIFLNIIFILNN